METQNEPDYRETYLYMVPREEHRRMARILSRDCYHSDVLCIGQPTHTYKICYGIDVELLSYEDKAFLKTSAPPMLAKWFAEGLETYFYFGKNVTLPRPVRKYVPPTWEELEARRQAEAELADAEDFDDTDEEEELPEFDWEAYAKERANGEYYYIMRYGDPRYGYCAEELNLLEPENGEEAEMPGEPPEADTREEWEREVDESEGGEEVIFDPGERVVTDDEELCVSSKALFLPKEGFTRVALNNLDGLLESKGSLIRNAFRIEFIGYTLTRENVIFDWLDNDASEDMQEAFRVFVTKLCDMAKTQKKVTSKARFYENEKYAFRCFLLRLGLIGDEYRTSRRELLRHLKGNPSWRDRQKKGDDEDEYLS
ncbi:MAG: hypothetical protein IJ849_09470 [Selenomonadaceae bacterium]|nr:hypothetical protein [Selenomonadaceae bacterium]